MFSNSLFFGVLCGGADVLRVLKFFFEVLDVLYVIIVALLVILIAIDLVKGIVSLDQGHDKVIPMIIKRCVLCLCLFLVKPIAVFTIDMLGENGVDFMSCVSVSLSRKDYSMYNIEYAVPLETVAADFSPEYTVEVVKSKYNGINVDSFIKALDDMSKQVEKDYRDGGAWRYINENIKNTFEEERADNRGVTCARYVNWAVNKIGIPSGSFWNCWGRDGCPSGNKVIWSEKTKKIVLEYFDLIYFPDNDNDVDDLIKTGKLKRGDIVFWYGHLHTGVYAGDKKWYDAGEREGQFGYFVDRKKKIYYFKSFGPFKQRVYDRVWAILRLK